MNKIQAMLVGANQEFGQSLKDYFDTHNRVKLILEGAGIDETLASVEKLKPDLIFVDSSSETIQPELMLKQIRDSSSSTKVCLLTVFEETIYSKFADQAGFDGVIPRADFASSIDQLLVKLFAGDNSQS